MRIQYLKDSEPYFEGDVVDVANEVGDSLIEKGVAKEVDPRTELVSFGAANSQDGMSVIDKRKKGLMDGPVPEEPTTSTTKPAKTTRKSKKADKDEE